jgi:hypothetical protein
MKWFVFDLDDTLIDNRKGRPRVARQTWHVLRRLSKREDYAMAIVSYNPGARLWAAMIGLTKYIPSNRIGILNNPSDRAELVASVLPLSFDPLVDSLFYFDDRADNIAEVKNAYPCVVAFEVRDPRKMNC